MGVGSGPMAAVRPTLVVTTGIVVALAVGTAGCTMCPDPFDYSGPVPNGSVTQNDFGARSNGILPLRAAPCPWPTVVEATPSETVPAEHGPTDAGAIAAQPSDKAAGDEAAAAESVPAESVLRVAQLPDLPESSAVGEDEPSDPGEPLESQPEPQPEPLEFEPSEVR